MKRSVLAPLAVLGAVLALACGGEVTEPEVVVLPDVQEAAEKAAEEAAAEAEKAAKEAEEAAKAAAEAAEEGAEEAAEAAEEAAVEVKETTKPKPPTTIKTGNSDVGTTGRKGGSSTSGRKGGSTGGSGATVGTGSRRK